MAGYPTHNESLGAKRHPGRESGGETGYSVYVSQFCLINNGKSCSYSQVNHQSTGLPLVRATMDPAMIGVATAKKEAKIAERERKIIEYENNCIGKE